MSVQSYSSVNDLPSEILVNVFNFLNLKELSCTAKVCSKWKNITNQCERKKSAFKDLIERRIISRVNNPNLKECYFIASMLGEEHATPRLVSKFIRGGADETCMLKAISIAKTITSEQFTDALDSRCSHSIFEAMITKMKEVPESAIISAIRQGNVEILSIFLKKSSLSPQILLNKSMDFENYQCVKLLFTLYPDIQVSVTEVIKSTEFTHLLAADFEAVLNQYLKREGNIITFDTVQRISSIIDTRLALHYAPHTENTEKIFELVASSYVKTNKINLMELLMKDFEVELFIRNGKHPLMAAKLIQAVENYV